MERQFEYLKANLKPLDYSQSYEENIQCLNWKRERTKSDSDLSTETYLIDKKKM